MRVAFLSRRYWPAVSGMSAYAENLLRHLVRQGHDFGAAAFREGCEAVRSDPTQADKPNARPGRARAPGGVNGALTCGTRDTHATNPLPVTNAFKKP